MYLQWKEENELHKLSNTFPKWVLRGLKRSNLPMFSTLIFCTIVRIILILTLFKMDYFHTLTWLYALYPITWALATFSNIGGILIFVPKDLKRLQNSEISQ